MLSFFFLIILLLWFLLIFPSFLYQFFLSLLFTSNSLFVFSLFCFVVFPCYSHFLDVFSLILFFHSHFYHFSPSLLSSFTFPCYLSPLSISSFWWEKRCKRKKFVTWTTYIIIHIYVIYIYEHIYNNNYLVCSFLNKT